MELQISVYRSVYQVIARTLSEAEGAVAIPWLEGKTIENCPKSTGLPHQCAHWFAMTVLSGEQ